MLLEISGEITPERMKIWDMTLKDELLRSVGTQYATGEKWRNNSERMKKTEPKQKEHPVVNVMGDGIKSDAVKKNIA